jgi:uncharacterized phage protein (TIGR02218 family)
MPTLPSSLLTALQRDETEVARLYWIRRRDGKSYFLTDWQMPLLMRPDEVPTGETSLTVRKFVPQQSPESSAITSEVGLGPSSGTITSYIQLKGIDLNSIRLGLFEGSQVFIYICNPSDDTSAALLTTGYLAGVKNLGDEKFEMDFKSIEEKLTKSVGQVVTERCWLKLGEKQCGIAARSALAIVNLVESPHSVIVTLPINAVWEVLNFWRFGAYYSQLTEFDGSTTFSITVSGNVIKSEYISAGNSRIVFLNSAYPELIVGSAIRLLEGCGCTVEDCNARGNIINYHGFPDLPGIDKLVSSAT